MNTSVVKYMMMRIGFLISISIELVIEVSISVTSPLIRAMMSPFFSSEKKASGRLTTFLYTFTRISLTTPVRSGIIMAAEPKYAPVFSKVAKARNRPRNRSVSDAP